MNLADCQQQMWLQVKSPGDGSTVGIHLRELVTGIVAEVERIERWPAAAAVARGKTGDQVRLTDPGRLQVVNFSLFNGFHL